jgi:hypothetical protein
MNRQLPPERPLPDKQRILRRILAETRGDAADEPEKRRRPWLIPVVAAAAVAAIVAAALVVPQTLKSGDPAVPPATTPAEPETSLDLGPLSQAEITEFLRHCKPWDSKTEKVLHTRKVRSGWGDGVEWTVAIQGRSLGADGLAPGDRRVTACSGRPTKSLEGTFADQNFRMENFDDETAPAPTAEELANLPEGSSFVTYRYDDSFRPAEGFELSVQPGKFTSSVWIKVPPAVDRVRQRLVVNGKAQQWFSNKAVDGLSYVHTWMEPPIREADTIELEVEFLDSSNQLVGVPGAEGGQAVLSRNAIQFDKRLDMDDYIIR